MPDTDPREGRVSDLRTRWEADPTSRVFLQLAEEYRHLGRLTEAVSVLEEGLKSQPTYLSARVALGRCRLETGDAARAAEELERVVAQDRTQMVAYKLLAEAYLACGKPAEARKQLDLYSLLNEGDPEVESLRARLAEPVADAAPASPEVVPPEVAVSAEPEATPPTPEIEPRTGPGEPVPEVRQAPAEDPFGDLSSEGDRQAYARELAGEDIFELGAEEEPQEQAGASAVEAAERPAPAATESVPAAPAAPTPAAVSPPPAPPPEAEPPPPSSGPATHQELPSPSAGATVTLGRLYLEQGHLEEADRIFRDILAAHPTNQAAKEGLARVEAAVSARGRVDPGTPVRAATGPTARRIAALEDYLRRLRRGADGHVS